MARNTSNQSAHQLPADDGGNGGHDSNQDMAILEAWERHRKAYVEYQTLPFGDGPDYTPEQKALLDIIDSADELLCSAVATTLEGVEVQLWTSLEYIHFSREDQEAILRRDIEHFNSKLDDLDFSVRMLLGAIRSVRAMSTPGAADFDPAEWVARFEAVGGYITPNGMGWQIDGRSQEDHHAALEIYRELETNKARKRAVEAFANQPEQVERYYRSLNREA